MPVGRRRGCADTRFASWTPLPPPESSASSGTFTTVEVNGQPGVIVDLHGRTMAVIAIDTDGQTVRAIRAIGNPDKLPHLNTTRAPRD